MEKYKLAAPIVAAQTVYFSLTLSPKFPNAFFSMPDLLRDECKDNQSYHSFSLHLSVLEF